MAISKVTMLFGYNAGAAGPPQQPDLQLGGGRVAGWSESWYTDLVPGTTQMDAALGRLGITRANLLASSIKIGPLRTQSVDPLGPAFLLNRSFFCATNIQQDIPQMALAVRMRGQSTRNRFVMELRGLPDARSVLGVYSPSVAFNNALEAYFTELRNWLFRGQDFAAETKPLESVSALGAYVLAADSTFISGARVKVLRTKTATGRQVSQVCTLNVTTNRTGTLVGWKQGATVAGNMRLVAYTYQTPRKDDQDPVTVNIRKVGRPSLVYRGKASRRRS